MKVFVAGSNGMLASDLFEKLEPLGEVSGDDLPELDITEPSCVREKLSQARPDVVINCAAYTAVDKAEEDKESSFAVNAKGAGVLASEASQLGARFIHISTDFVFDGSRATPYAEDDEPNPLGQYGASKLEGELEVRANAKDHIIIRTSWLYGHKGKNFVKTIKEKAEVEEELSVVYDQVGAPTYTVDLAEAIVGLIKEAPSGTYHFSNEGVASWYDLACRIVEEMQALGLGLKTRRINPVLSEQYPTPAKRPPYSVMDKAKYKAVSGAGIEHWAAALKRFMKREWG